MGTEISSRQITEFSHFNTLEMWWKQKANKQAKMNTWEDKLEMRRDLNGINHTVYNYVCALKQEYIKTC